MEDPLDLDETQEIIIEVLNGTDAAVIAIVIAFALHNIVKYLCIEKINHYFIITFYFLAIFCLVAWFVTAVTQVVQPRIRYLVFQKLDNPTYFHIAADLSNTAFIALFALVSATVYHLDQALSLVLLDATRQTEQ